MGWGHSADSNKGRVRRGDARGWRARFRVEDFSGYGARAWLRLRMGELYENARGCRGDDAMRMNLACALVTAAAMTVAGGAQTTGVSHPEQVPMTSGGDELQQPAVMYAAPAKPSAALKMRTAEVAPSSYVAPVMVSPHVTRAVQRAGDVDGMIVGDDVSGLVPQETDDGIVTRIEGPSNRLPVGTMVTTRITQALTTKATPEGAEFTAELTEPVLRDGRVLLPAGSVLSGRVTDVHGGRRITGTASIHLQPRAITLPDGTRYKMYGQVIDTSLYKHVKVDDEGTILRRDHKLATASALGLATGSGAAAGAVFGGWPGAVIGGAVGAGVGTAVWLKQDRQEELPAGTKVVFSLISPLTVGME